MKKTDEAFLMGYIMGSGGDFDGSGCLGLIVLIIVVRFLDFILSGIFSFIRSAQGAFASYITVFIFIAILLTIISPKLLNRFHRKGFLLFAVNSLVGYIILELIYTKLGYNLVTHFGNNFVYEPIRKFVLVHQGTDWLLVFAIILYLFCNLLDYVLLPIFWLPFTQKVIWKLAMRGRALVIGNHRTSKSENL